MTKFNENKISLLTLSLACTLIIALLFYMQSIKVITKINHENIYNTLISNAGAIEHKIENTELLSHQLTNIITSTISYETIKDDPEAIGAYKDRIIPLFLQTIKDFNAKTGWVVFDTEQIKDGGTISYSKADTFYYREPEYDVRKTGYYKQDWWQTAEKNGISWSTPYYWAPWNTTIITYSEQVKVNDKIIAMAGSELYFNDIAQQLSNIKLYQTGYMTLINEENKILYDPNNNVIGKDFSVLNNNQFNLIDDKIKTGQTIDIIDDIPNEKNKLLAYIRLKNGWVLLTRLSKSEISFELNRLHTLMFFLIIFLLALHKIGSMLIKQKS